MANETIPESISFTEAQAIQHDESHPLRAEYKKGNEQLIERIDRAYQAHYGGQQEREGSTDEQTDREHKELQKKFENAVDLDEITHVVTQAAQHAQDLAVEEFGEAGPQKIEEANKFRVDNFFGGDEQKFSRSLVDSGIHLSGPKQFETVKWLLKIKNMR